ncbi:MAG: polyprenyl synthetase family protein [Sandaracinaceae bacterium]
MTTRIDSALERALSAVEDSGPPQLAAAIRYAVFPGGARIRPRLCVAVAEACGAEDRRLVDGAAAALELLHCASLVHDDLPCFDDADLRRGKPSVHRAFGEPLAVLVGDALIVLAYETLGRAAQDAPQRLPGLLAILTRAAGAPHGLVAGQAWESEPWIPLEAYHRAKTGALFVAAAMSGALAAGQDPAPWRTMGERLGEAYQVADDLFDAHGSSSSGGKPAHQDAALRRPSAVETLGTHGAVAKLRLLVAEAAAAVPEGPGAPPLRALVVAMAERLVPASLRQSAA